MLPQAACHVTLMFHSCALSSAGTEFLNECISIFYNLCVMLKFISEPLMNLLSAELRLTVFAFLKNLLSTELRLTALALIKKKTLQCVHVHALFHLKSSITRWVASKYFRGHRSPLGRSATNRNSEPQWRPGLHRGRARSLSTCPHLK